MTSAFRLNLPSPWPTTAAEAHALQETLRPMVDRNGSGTRQPSTIAGLDVAYDTDSDLLVAAVVVLEAGSLKPVDSATVAGRATFGYVPGLLAFREVPWLVAALNALTVRPDLLVCDGYGVAHPRRFGLACHIGLITELPTIGVAKTPFVGVHGPLGPNRGDTADLTDDAEVIGRAVRTRDATRQVYVSVGHRCDLDTACRHVLALTPRYRQPETIRHADHLSRAALKRMKHDGAAGCQGS